MAWSGWAIWIKWGLLGALLVAAVLGVYPLAYRMKLRRVAELQREITALDNPLWLRHVNLNSSDVSIREREGWTPADFFSEPQAIHACEWITQDELGELQAAIKRGLDVNLAGREGFTLLHWAYIDDDLPAFEMLLVAGASPDRVLVPEQKLSALCLTTTNSDLFYGDSLLFTTVRANRRQKWSYFIPALKKSRDVNQRDPAGETLLLVAGSVHHHTSVTEEALQAMIDAGLNLDAQGRYATTAVQRFAQFRPDLSLQLIEAGANTKGLDEASVVAWGTKYRQQVRRATQARQQREASERPRSQQP